MYRSCTCRLLALRPLPLLPLAAEAALLLELLRLQERLLELEDEEELMVGDGELRQRCEEEVSKRQLPVTFTGFLNQSEIISAYVGADCLVLSSDAGETWGLVVNEAMACSRPALVSDLAGCHLDLIKPVIDFCQ